LFTLYHCNGTRSIRPLWTVEELGLDCDLVTLPFPPRVQAKAFRQINPLVTVPFLVDGDEQLTESVAICQYLVSRYAPQSPLNVRPDESEYGAYLNWLSFSEATLSFPLTIVFRYSELEPEGRRLSQAVDDYRAFFLGRLKLLRAALEEHEFLCANRFTIADICACFALHQARDFGVEEAFAPPVRAYWERMTARPAYQQAVATRPITPVWTTTEGAARN